MNDSTCIYNPVLAGSYYKNSFTIFYDVTQFIWQTYSAYFFILVKSYAICYPKEWVIQLGYISTFFVHIRPFMHFIIHNSTVFFLGMYLKLRSPFPSTLIKKYPLLIKFLSTCFPIFPLARKRVGKGGFEDLSHLAKYLCKHIYHTSFYPIYVLFLVSKLYNEKFLTVVLRSLRFFCR